MSWVYIAGYGRSGSTALGRAIAYERAGVSVGEATHVRSAAFVVCARCACGESFVTCAYWSRVAKVLAETPRTGGELWSSRWAAACEGVLGLVLPLSALRRIVKRLQFSEQFPGVSFAVGVQAMSDVAEGPVIDGSKTTRTTANRARMIHAAGQEVDLIRVHRAWRGVVASHVAAAERRGRSRGPVRSGLTVAFGRGLARLAARNAAVSLGVPLTVVPLEQTLERLQLVDRAGTADHAIAGNRRRWNESGDQA